MSELEFWKDIGNISEAILNYQKKNAEFNDRFIKPWLKLGTMVERTDRSIDMAQAYQHAVEIDPANPQNWFELAQVYFQSGDYEQACAAFQKSAELAPYNAAALSELAYTLSLLKRYEEAVPLYLASLDLMPEDKEMVLVLNRLGEAYRKLNDYEKAFLTFQHADAIEKGKPAPATAGQETAEESAVAALGEDLDEEVEEEAISPLSYIERVLPIVPQQAQTMPAPVESIPAEDEAPSDEFEKVTAVSQIEEEELDEEEDVPAHHISVPSIEFLPSWLSEEAKKNLAPEHGGNIKTRAPEWLVMDQTPETGMDFPDDPPSNVSASSNEDRLASDHESLGKFQVVAAAPADEEDDYDEYLKSIIDPEDELSDHMDDLKNPSAHSDDQDPMLDMDTKNAQVLNEMGNMYMQSSQFDEAIKAYGRAMALERHYAWPYSNMALAYVQKGLFPNALLLYQRSIELFTNDRDKAITWNRLGNLYRRMNDYDNMLAAYRTADELDPGSAAQAIRSSFGLLGRTSVENTSVHAG